MYQSILEYVVNADLFYRLWMVAEHQNPSPSKNSHAGRYQAQPRTEWLSDLVAATFDDVQNVPAVVRVEDPHHLLNGEFQFHTGNKQPTINALTMQLFWGVDFDDLYSGGSAPANFGMRGCGPCRIDFTGLKMWHHQDRIHRRRGDAVICEQIRFLWNTKQNGPGLYRTNGPYEVTISNFRAAYRMGVPQDASYSKLSVGWSTEDGARLGEQRVEGVINRNEIGVNYLFADSVFTDPGEEFIFWDEIGRLEAA